MVRESPPPAVGGLDSVGLALVVGGRLVLDEMVERVVIGLPVAAEVDEGGAVTVVVVVVVMLATVVELAVGSVTTDDGLGVGLAVVGVALVLPPGGTIGEKIP